MTRIADPPFLTFGRWQPDLPTWRNDGAIVVNGVIPRRGFYAPLRKPTNFSAAVDDRVLGAIAASRSLDGSVFNYAATGTKIYQMAADLTWTDSTRLIGSDYTTASDDRWEFVQFGEAVIGVNGWSDVPQAIILGDTNFDALAGTPPSARHIAVIGSFVVLANTLDSVDGARTQRLWWCAFNNATGWTPDIATQCSFRDLRGSGGKIQRIIGGEYGVVYRERSIARMTYIGPPGVFQVDELEGEGHGLLAPWSAVKHGRLHYYLSDDGWHAFDGQASKAIGRDIIDTTFFNDFDSSYAKNVIGCVDPISQLIFWIYPGQGAVGGLPNRVLMLDPDTMQFSTAAFDNEFLAPLYSSLPVTTDAVDSLYAFTDSTPPNPGFTDDGAFTGGTAQLAFFRTDHVAAYLAGGNFAATFDTGERQINPSGRAFVEGLRPMIDAATGVTVTCLERDTPSQATVTVGESDTVDAAGEAHPRSNARFHRFRIGIAEDTDWTKAEGVYLSEVASAGVY